MISVSGKVIIVTGAAQGLGKAYAEYLAENQAKLVLVDSSSKIEDVARELQSKHRECFGMKVDVTRESDTRTMAEEAVKRYGRIDVLINNAAMFSGLVKKSFANIPLSEWDDVMAVNAKGVFLCCRAVFPQMKAQGSGKIINVASATFFNGTALLSHYVASKGAVIGLTHALARELGEYNITVNALAPGLTVTDAAVGIESNSDYLKQVLNRRSLKREQFPRDLTGTILYLCSSASDFVTGQTIVVNGGDTFS